MNARAITFLAIVLLSTSCGCTTAIKSVTAKFDKPPEPHGGELSEVMALWQPGEGRGADGLPTRGFAGQIFFFRPGNAEPVPVDADIVIYVFDNVGSPEEQKEPVHRFHFSSEAFQTHLGPSSVGTCYQLFLPYTRPGDHHAVCSLRVIAQPRNGSRTASQSADVTLEGRRADRTPPLQPVDWSDRTQHLEVRPTDSKMTGQNASDRLNVFSIPLTSGQKTRRKTLPEATR